MGGAIEALGYLGLEVSKPEEWRVFLEDLLGLQIIARDEEEFDARMDDYGARLHITSGSHDDLSYLGWEVRDAIALENLKSTLTEADIAFQVGDARHAETRGVAALMIFRDPEGNVNEAFFGPLKKTDDPFVSPRGVSFKTGSQGLGHAVLNCRDVEKMARFYTDILGFRVSDYIRTEVIPGRPINITFLRCNGRHHSLALAPVGIHKKLIHFMLEVEDLDQVGFAQERCEAANIHFSFTLGRHSNDEMLSFYVLTPSGFDIEFGWGGLTVNDETWHVVAHHANSKWGHRFQRPPTGH